mmetsp:Transcript_51089/g.85465  ORF Transcript_51089/g.85465 Transcript_51089/m.85465 type:complete len:485 (-) Transcript_51089:25-1479(-)
MDCRVAHLAIDNAVTGVQAPCHLSAAHVDVSVGLGVHHGDLPFNMPLDVVRCLNDVVRGGDLGNLLNPTSWKTEIKGLQAEIHAATGVHVDENNSGQASHQVNQIHLTGSNDFLNSSSDLSSDNLDDQWVSGSLVTWVVRVRLQRNTDEHEILLPGNTWESNRARMRELGCAAQPKADEQLHARALNLDALCFNNSDTQPGISWDLFRLGVVLRVDDCRSLQGVNHDFTSQISGMRLEQLCVSRVLHSVVPPHLLLGWGWSNVNLTDFGTCFDQEILQLLDTRPQICNGAVQATDLRVFLSQHILQFLDSDNEGLLLAHEAAFASKLCFQVSDRVLQTDDDSFLLLQNTRWNPVPALFQQFAQLANRGLSFTDHRLHPALLLHPHLRFHFQLLQSSTQLSDDSLSLTQHFLQVVALGGQLLDSFHVSWAVGALYLDSVPLLFTPRNGNNIATVELTVPQLPFSFLRGSARYLRGFSHDFEVEKK